MADHVIFVNAFLIDGNGGKPLCGAALVVAGSKIQDILLDGPKCNGLRFRQAQVIDLQGRALMPGLIDAHVHPGNVEWYLRDTAKLPPAVFVHRVSETLEADLELGFTTLRDAGGLDRGFREAVNQHLIRGPRLLLSVTPITARTSGEKPESRNSLGIAPELCNGPEQMGLAVQRTLKRGADQVKVFADGEVVSQSRADRARPGQLKFTAGEMSSAAAAAEAAGSYVMAHAYSPAAIQVCLQAGVRSIEHGNLMDRETARIMAERGAYYVPTLTTFDVLQKEGEAALDAFTLEKLKIVGHRGKEALELAHRAGVRIGSGSDIIGPLQHLKGRELAIKAEVMGAMAAIVSATRINADMVGLADQIGTLEIGKRADLIVLDGNPLEDITLFEKGFEKVLLVMKEGRIVKDLIPQAPKRRRQKRRP